MSLKGENKAGKKQKKTALKRRTKEKALEIKRKTISIFTINNRAEIMRREKLQRSGEQKIPWFHFIFFKDLMLSLYEK